CALPISPQLELRAVDPESTGATPALERRRRPVPEPASEDRSWSRTPDERWGTPTGAQRQQQEAGDHAVAQTPDSSATTRAGLDHFVPECVDRRHGGDLRFRDDSR